MSKPWGGTATIGSWAAEAELAEAEEQQQLLQAAQAAPPPASFPTLREAVTTKPKKKKMTLSDFNNLGSTSRLSHDDHHHLRLPTGPTLRHPDDPANNSRSGFNNNSYAPRGGGGGGGFDGGPGRRGGGGGGDYDMPSRADEVDNWASMKRPVSVAPERERERGSRYGALGGGSRADDVDNWNFGKKATNAPPLQSQSVRSSSSSFGTGFRDAGGSDWRRGEPLPPIRDEVAIANRPRLVLDPRSNESSNSESGGRKGGNPFGAARPREEVLAEKGLDWKKLDLEIEAKKASGGTGSRPTSSGGSRPTSSHSNRSESGGGGGEVKARVKVNPFGEAKPREVLLEEKGLDWRKIDSELEHRSVDRTETEEEKALKEEIENLRKDLEKESVSDVSQGPGGEQSSVRDLIQSKEKDLENLIRELDDKVRFGQKAVERPGSGAGRNPERPVERPGSGAGRYPERPVERPGSGAGRYTSFPERPVERPGSGSGRYASFPERPVERPGSGAGRYTGFPERPPPQPGFYGDARGPEAMDRPRSRGSGDVWTRPGEDRRGGFQGGRDRGFMGNRDFNRSSSRERW